MSSPPRHPEPASKHLLSDSDHEFLSKSRRNLKSFADPRPFSDPEAADEAGGATTTTGSQSGFGGAKSPSFNSTTSSSEVSEKLEEMGFRPAMQQPHTGKKISIVGCGQVGLAIAYAVLNRAAAGTIALVDVNGPKLDGEVKDLCQGSAFHPRVRVVGSTDYAITGGSRLVVVTAGAARKPTETRLDLVKKNCGILKAIIPKVLEHSPDAAICIVSNPCDVMTAVANKVAGPTVPPGRIFGSGTNLDSSRLRSLIAASLDIDTKSVHGYIVGEHGESCVPVWSSVRIGGVPLLPYGEEPGTPHMEMHAEVVKTSTDVIRLKGYTNWAVGLSVTHIATCVLDDTRSILPVSTCVRGYGGVKEDVYLSLPCVVGASGVVQMVEMHLTDHERKLFHKSADKVWDVQKHIWDQV